MPAQCPSHPSLRVALIADFKEEGWPSMDRVADTLHRELLSAEDVSVELVRPSMRRFFSRFPGAGRGKAAFNADRLLNRFWVYPSVLRRLRSRFDLFHLTDHSYSQLVHCLDPRRVLVTCHDLDTFQCILEPEQHPAGIAFRLMANRILTGFRKASRITCDSQATLDGVLRHRLQPASRATLCRMGVDDAFFSASEKALEPFPRTLIHVGSTIPRKRIDILLRVFAQVRKRIPDARLIRVGGELSAPQARLAQELGVGDVIDSRVRIPEAQLCELLARSTLLLLPSESEGFGLPVVEAMAAGTPVLCSDLPVLCEVGGVAAEYAPVTEVDPWTDRVCALLLESESSQVRWSERREQCRQQARQFTWSSVAANCIAIYKEMLEELGVE